VVIHHQPNLLAISPSPTMTLKSPANRAFVRAAAEGTWCSFASRCQNGLRHHDRCASPINLSIGHRVRCMPRIPAVIAHLPGKPRAIDKHQAASCVGFAMQTKSGSRKRVGVRVSPEALQ
jgi:hypothetical protein